MRLFDDSLVAGVEPELDLALTLRRAAAVALGVLALLPVLLLWRFIATTGANALSNDYLYWVPVVEQLLGGTNQWSHYFRDTFLGGSHSYAIPVLVTAAIATFFDFSVNATLYFALGLAVIKVALMHAAIAGRSTHWLRHALWPVLSALVFSAANINLYTFGFTATHVGLTELGFVLGLWSLTRFRGRWQGLAGMAAGGLLATWSWGSGLVVWPVFALAWPLLGGARRRAVLVWAVAGAVACLPYALYFQLGDSAPQLSGAEVLNKLRMAVEAIGWPFSGNFDQVRAKWAGRLGAGLLVVGLGQLALSRKRDWAEVLPGLMLLGYGLAVAGEMVLVRSQLVSWYTSELSFIWIGLLALGFSVWTRAGRSGAEALWCGELAASVVLLYATNGGYGGKVFYLASRGPAAASCLRNHREAPPGCESSLFQWRPGHPEHIAALGGALERHGWGVFGPRQEWSLQGDSMLDSVDLEVPANSAPVLWAGDRSPEPLLPSDYRRLNLFLPPRASVRWTMKVPRNPRRAEFISAVSTSTGGSAGRAFQVFIQSAKGTQSVFEWADASEHQAWETISVPLTGYAGQEISLILTSGAPPPPGEGWAVFQYPRVELDFDRGTASLADRTAEEVPARSHPRASERDLIFELKERQLWRASAGLTPANQWEDGRWWVENDPILEYLGPLDVPLSDYSHLQVTAAVSANCFFRSMQVFYRTTADAQFTEAHSFRVPLYGGPARLYSYRLGQLGLPAGGRLTGIRVDPIDGSCGGGATQVEVSNLRLVKRPERANQQSPQPGL